LGAREVENGSPTDSFSGCIREAGSSSHAGGDIGCGGRLMCGNAGVRDRENPGHKTTKTLLCGRKEYSILGEVVTPR
jgi:hypothetical protein